MDRKQREHRKILKRLAARSDDRWSWDLVEYAGAKIRGMASRLVADGDAGICEEAERNFWKLVKILDAAEDSWERYYGALRDDSLSSEEKHKICEECNESEKLLWAEFFRYFGEHFWEWEF